MKKITKRNTINIIEQVHNEKMFEMKISTFCQNDIRPFQDRAQKLEL